jgi:hypothetical protein
VISVNEPIEQCTIRLTEMLTPEGDTPRKIHGIVEFKSVKHLGAYLSGRYSVAISIGYNLKSKPKRTNERLIGRLALYYKDRYTSGTFEFDNVNQFAKFLKENPLFALALEYHPE